MFPIWLARSTSQGSYADDTCRDQSSYALPHCFVSYRNSTTASREHFITEWLSCCHGTSITACAQWHGAEGGILLAFHWQLHVKYWTCWDSGLNNKTNHTLLILLALASLPSGNLQLRGNTLTWLIPCERGNRTFSMAGCATLANVNSCSVTKSLWKAGLQFTCERAILPGPGAYNGGV